MTIRDGFHTITPYLTTPDLDGLVAFLKEAFGATETRRERGGGGGEHVEMRIGDSMLMVGGAPHTTTAMLFLYVDDPDAWHARAVAAGAESLEEPKAAADGGRRAGVRDAFGNVWYFGHP